MILITTSRRPVKRVRTFVKELERVIPNCARRPRGKSSLKDLKNYMILNGFDKLIIVDVYRWNPGRIHFFKLRKGALKRVALMYLKSISMQIDLRESFVASKLNFELNESCSQDEEAKRFFHFIKDFFSEEVVVEEREGGELTLKVSRANETISIRLLSSKTGELIRPYFDVEKVIWTCEEDEAGIYL